MAITKVDLENSKHGTQQKEQREKERSLEWCDSAASLAAWRGIDYYYVTIECKRLERFRFIEKDFTRIAEALISCLPLTSLLKIDKLLTRKISLAVTENIKELKKQNAYKVDVEDELSVYRNEVWKLRNEIRELKSQLDSQP